MTVALEGGWVVSSTPRPHFAPGKDPVPILQEAGWAPESVWTGGKTCPHQDSIPDHPAGSQLLYRLSCPAHNSTYVSCLYWSHQGGIFLVSKSWEMSPLHLRCVVVLYLTYSHVSKFSRHTCKAISHSLGLLKPICRPGLSWFRATSPNL